MRRNAIAEAEAASENRRRSLLSMHRYMPSPRRVSQRLNKPLQESVPICSCNQYRADSTSTSVKPWHAASRPLGERACSIKSDRMLALSAAAVEAACRSGCGSTCEQPALALNRSSQARCPSVSTGECYRNLIHSVICLAWATNSPGRLCRRIAPADPRFRAYY